MNTLGRCTLSVALVLGLWAYTSPGYGGEAQKKPVELTGRDLIVKLVRTVQSSPHVSDRVMAIRQLGSQSDKALLEEFGVLQLLTEVPKDKRRLPRERSEALNALVQLYRKGIGHPQTMEILISIVEEQDRNVRMDALLLIAEMADDKVVGDVVKHKAFAALEKIWKNRLRSKLPTRMAEAVIETIGGFPTKDGTMTMLTEGLKDKRAAVRSGALRGLQRYLQSAEKVNRRLADEIFRLFAKSDTVEERVELILVIDMMAAVDKTVLNNQGATRKKLLALLGPEEGGYGTDAEVQAAVRVLLRIADDSIVDAMVKAAKPDKVKGWGYPTYVTLSNSLIDIMVPLRENPKKYEKTVEKILGHYLFVLNPKWLKHGGGTPEPLVRSAILNLGMWPVEFDRRKVVATLITTLENLVNDGWEDMIGECEKSLQYLTGEKPFRKWQKVEGGTKELPDLDKWKLWYDANQKLLEPGKHPLDQ